MSKKKKTKSVLERKGLKKVRVEHYCRECGKLYLVRQALGWKREPSIQRFKGHCCLQCAQTDEDILIQAYGKLYQRKI